MYYHSKHVEQKIKQVTSVGLSLFNYQEDARSNKHKIVTSHRCGRSIIGLMSRGMRSVGGLRNSGHHIKYPLLRVNLIILGVRVIHKETKHSLHVYVFLNKVVCLQSRSDTDPLMRIATNNKS